MESCAACGKHATEGLKLKACKACQLVKYCNVDCQVAHRPLHKKACREEVAESFDRKLFAVPGSREDCPICYVTLPVDSETAYKSCCGKSICIACILNLASTGNNRCPFCNAPTTRGLKNEYRMLNERIEKYNDASAMSHLGLCLNSGLNGFPVDQPKAFEMYKRASAGGNIMSNYNLGNSYF